MALNQQSNWDISMQENLEQSIRKMKRDGMLEDTESTADTVVTEGAVNHNTAWQSEPIYLPDEVLIQILDYTTHSPSTSQRTLASCCLLSHQWFSAAVPLLYAHPYLYGHNFDPFVRAVSPSINLHVRKSPLSELVKSLNMSNLVHQGSRSLTARLLGRTKGSLEEFVAPQASFAINCLPALSKCHRLRILDLSLVSESPPLPDLLEKVSHLSNLKTFRLPRSAGFGVHHKSSAFAWPPNLEELCLSGGIDGHFSYGVVAFPQTLRRITIEHCPHAKGYAVVHMLKTAVRPLKNLESLKIRYMPRLGSRALDGILFLLPQIKTLSVSVDYITPAIFDEGHFNHEPKELLALNYNPEIATSVDQPQVEDALPLEPHALRTLELTSSGNSGIEDKITPIDVMIAIDDGGLPNLRQVRVAKSLHWHSSTTASDAEALADVLQDASKRDWMAARGIDAKAVDAWEGEKPWEKNAGVYLLDR